MTQKCKEILGAISTEEYWYVSFSFHPTGFNTRQVEYAAIQGSPAVWAVSQSFEAGQGDYIIMYAERITKEMFNFICENH